MIWIPCDRAVIGGSVPVCHCGDTSWHISTTFEGRLEVQRPTTEPEATSASLQWHSDSPVSHTNRPPTDIK